jgi:type II secretory pathway pseudopilin PulG
MAIAGLVLGYAGLAILPILIIAAIAIPNLLRSRMAANEASAVASLRTYNTALARYAVECPQQGYPPNPTQYLELDGSRPSSCPQESLTSIPQGGELPMKSIFLYPDETRRRRAYFKIWLSGGPSGSGATGVRHFYTDETGLIRSSLRGGADSKSPQIQ